MYSAFSDRSPSAAAALSAAVKSLRLAQQGFFFGLEVVVARPGDVRRRFWSGGSVAAHGMTRGRR